MVDIQTIMQENGVPLITGRGEPQGVTPRSILESRDAALRQSIQEDFKIEADRLEKTPLTAEEFQKHKKKLHEAFQDRYRKESAGLKAQMQGLSEIESLVTSGQATPQAGMEQGMRSVLDTEAERAVFPRQAEPVSKQYSAQLLYRDKLDSLLAQFEEQPGGKKIKQWHKPWFMEGKTTAKLQIYTGKDKDKNPTFRDATPEEIQEYGLLKAERNRVAETMNVLLQDTDMSNRLRKAVATSGRKMGISESFAKTLQDQRRDTIPDTQQPKYQVNRVTGAKRVSYDGGKWDHPMIVLVLLVA